MSTNAREGGWQPIETAPKDKAVLCANQEDVFIAWYQTETEHWSLGSLAYDDEKLLMEDDEPTHWMPLPKPVKL